MSATQDRQLLAGGFRNEIWKVRRGSGFVIEKKYREDSGAPNPMFPNFPEHEALILAFLGGKGLSPALVEFVPKSKSESARVIYNFVPGTQWKRGVAEVAKLLGTLHALRAPKGLRKLCVSAKMARDHGDAMLLDVPVRLKKELLAFRPNTTRKSSPLELSLVHTDCGPGNILRSKHGLILIDWQCPGVGDAVEDIACFLSPAMMVLYRATPHSEAAKNIFLDSYSNELTVARYVNDAAAWHFRIGAYCAWRAHELKNVNPSTARLYSRALAAEILLLRELK